MEKRFASETRLKLASVSLRIEATPDVPALFTIVSSPPMKETALAVSRWRFASTVASPAA